MLTFLNEMNDLVKVGLVGVANAGAAGVQKAVELAHENVQIIDTLHVFQIVLAAVSIVYVTFKIIALAIEKFQKRDDA